MPAQWKSVAATTLKDNFVNGMHQSPSRLLHNVQRIKNALAADNALSDTSLFKKVDLNVVF